LSVVRDQRSGANVMPLSVAEARRHLRKAEEYLRSAQAALEGDDGDAAGGTAVLAGINASDAVCGLVLGNHWCGPHEQAAAHAQKAGDDGKAVADQLRKLVRKKTQAHYQVKELRPAEAAALVLAAKRAVVAAQRAEERIARS